MIRISIKHLRKILDDLIEEHNPGKFGGCCQCTLCQESGQLCNELDEHREGFLVLEHGKEEVIVETWARDIDPKTDVEAAIQKIYEGARQENIRQEEGVQGSSQAEVPDQENTFFAYHVMPPDPAR